MQILPSVGHVMLNYLWPVWLCLSFVITW